MKREYVQPKVDIVNLTSTTSFLAGSTGEEIGDDKVGDGDDWDANDDNAPADPWA